MTKILAFADTQLGVPTVDLADQRDVLDRIVQVALNDRGSSGLPGREGVDAVLHGGDVFEGPVVTPEQLRVFIDAVRPLNEYGIPLLIIRGNGRHDMAVREVNALDVLREVDGIQIVDSPTVAILADKVAVCALPWVHPGKLIASMNGGLTHEQADATTSELLLRIARHLYQSLHPIGLPAGTPMLPTVLLAHWAISGSALPTGLPVDEMREPILSWPDLDAIGFDAVIGAHIHQPQQISNPEIDSTLGIVVGSPQQLNHGEHGEHGCWIIDIPALTESVGGRHPVAGNNPTDSASAEFVPIQSKQFITANFGEAPIGVTHFPAYQDAIVRIRYNATEDEARQVEHEYLRRRALEAGASHVTIEPQIIRKERARAQQISEQLSPLDALAAYCDANEVDTERAIAMLARLKEWNET